MQHFPPDLPAPPHVFIVTAVGIRWVSGGTKHDSPNLSQNGSVMFVQLPAAASSCDESGQPGQQHLVGFAVLELVLHKLSDPF